MWFLQGWIPQVNVWFSRTPVLKQLQLAAHEQGSAAALALGQQGDSGIVKVFQFTCGYGRRYPTVIVIAMSGPAISGPVIVNIINIQKLFADTCF